MAKTELMIEPIERLKKDVREAAKRLTVTEVRYLVDLYYQIQEVRKGSGNQITTMTKTAEPVFVLSWTHNTMERIEEEIRKAMDIYTDHESSGMGAWAKAICGIGPVISAGLLASIDITRAPTVGHIWRFAGLDPTCEWKKGEKRPWNASLKVLCWKIGQSFMKVSGNENDVYGKIYLARKAFEITMNDSGARAETAKQTLEKKTYRKTTEAYKAYAAGKLPAGQIDARARRYAVKQFLSDWHGEAYRRHYKTEPPKPYPIAILGHAHYRQPLTAAPEVKKT